MDPLLYRCGIRTALPDGRIQLRLIREPGVPPVSLTSADIAPAELDLTVPAGSDAACEPSQLVEIAITVVRA